MEHQVVYPAASDSHDAPNTPTTTRHVALLSEQFRDGDLVIAPEFQRNSVWPRVAKAHLIDSVLKNRPIPALLFHRKASGQSGKTKFIVVDGQQRLRAVVDYVNNRYSLTPNEGVQLAGKRFRELPAKLRSQIMNYDFVIEELSGYSQAQIRDTFAAVNRYVIKLNNQELRNAKESGEFANMCKSIGVWGDWMEHRIFTNSQKSRMREIEFAAELLILLAEGPQNKKTSIDVWYAHYRSAFPGGHDLRNRVRKYLTWIAGTLNPLSASRFRKPVDLYALFGALDRVTEEATWLDSLSQAKAGENLTTFDEQLTSAAKKTRKADSKAARYLIAASRQTDNLVPRSTRIEILESLLNNAWEVE